MQLSEVMLTEPVIISLHTCVMVIKRTHTHAHTHTHTHTVTNHIVVFMLQTRRLVLKHEGAENFNWNYVDQHILGYQDFAELPEVGNILVSKHDLLRILFNSLHGIKSSAVVTYFYRQNKCGSVNRTLSLSQGL